MFPNDLSAKLFGLVSFLLLFKGNAGANLLWNMTHSVPKNQDNGVHMCSYIACLFIKGSSKCVNGLFMTDRILHSMVNACVFGVCVRDVHCCSRYASKRSEWLTAESQGLRRQEIKHEMKTSSSLNILPSHFPISPFPLADLKGRREEND